MNQTLQTLKGFRDFLPAEKRARDYVSAKIVKTFQRFGFEPLETPTLEYAELLLGKYGKEADQLVYSFKDRGDRNVALRYDQSVPTARVLAQYQNELGKGFRRYQIQNVFRADKPQKGRYREFCQCDADIFGVTSPLADAEILAVYAAIYQDLGFSNLTIKINDRKILFDTLTSYATDLVSVFSIIQSIDKLDKQSVDDVVSELVNKGLKLAVAQEAIAKLQKSKATENLTEIIDATIKLGVPKSMLEFSPTLARGLDYYTGMIFEGVIPGMSGSVGGGGRYDNLIKTLGGPQIAAVGFGLGFDRTVEAAMESGLIKTENSTQVLVSIFSTELQNESLRIVTELRRFGINAELYPDANDKLEKQLKYADKKEIQFVVIAGEDEVKRGVVKVKNLKKKEQKEIALKDIRKAL
ncbi:histidine--tRNA ligase [Candidatus Dojkabacteria bacterium CG_4_9_14_3_um_filter_150_Dojkabacteria_WS6_41_13]|uniref:Histidine--tRNA ligase n=1 Tax=Candidatus Dojkabacteria bacterium CG_4_10_14_0_2_um_filter_Dojkabacteria_WS6_41_15 TaxID=2014249 RepID=A0A2M7W255_9BACT|nr:MAG: histidine--tRNA ligase [Candidatus Dojkabacteria bacterium CG_4_10_14_3_um_filter_Dojkabacteria_WS6_41_9]PJA14349.1 MAG: histidine--tRNA ligase [Candidatus Dojkabacteria bacterium CG_4_10_14_0_2_um_filter_Dojkabacteria_WS6_41_15]PJB22668.1 MAG: histidine--tRNA ligase [Candidatus Dojkabacteria bacterium CG_4_9_14_3_um_filter_150_Dojkabacteria_WS6_41_13]